MKELDLTGTKLLKLWLRMGYHDYQITGEKDICTLVRMCLRSGLCGVGYLTTIAIIAAMGAALLWVVYLMFSFLTLFLPEAYYASVDDILFGLILLLIVSFIALLGTLADVMKGRVAFAPEYMKRPLRKLFKLSGLSVEYSTVRENKPSQTWIACKEMFRSVKEKTCIKVKL